MKVLKFTIFISILLCIVFIKMKNDNKDNWDLHSEITLRDGKIKKILCPTKEYSDFLKKFHIPETCVVE